MASALHRHPFNLVGNESSLAMRPAELANSREFNAKFSLFLRVFGENDVSAIDPACKKKVRWVARSQNLALISPKVRPNVLWSTIHHERVVFRSWTRGFGYRQNVSSEVTPVLRRCLAVLSIRARVGFTGSTI